MAVHARITQLHATETASGPALLAASYAIVDTVAGTSTYRSLFGISCTIDAPATWKASIVAAIVADAAVAGYTLTEANLGYPAVEPGDYREPLAVGCWTKDITKTNIGTTLVNVYVGAGGEGQLVDFGGGWTQYRLVVFANKVGTGNQNISITDVDNAANRLDHSYTGAAGEFALDTGWTALPAWANGEKRLKPQASSTVATDDPVYHSFMLYLR